MQQEHSRPEEGPIPGGAGSTGPSPIEAARRRERRGTWRWTVGTSLVLIVVTAAIWILWGFRWPPTAEVVVQAQETGMPARAADDGATTGR